MLVVIRTTWKTISFAGIQKPNQRASKAADSKDYQPTTTAPQRSFKKRWLLPVALTLSPLLGAVPGLAQSIHRLFSDNVDGKRITTVNSARDIAHVKGATLGTHQKVVDLLDNPLLSPQARDEIEAILNELIASGNGEMAVVVIPRTDKESLGGLSTEIYNQIGIGKQGENRGALLLVNAERVRSPGRGGRMALTPGHGFNEILTSDRATQILRDNAVPAINRKDYDTAVRDTVQAVRQLMAETAPQKRPTGNPFSSSGSSQSSPGSTRQSRSNDEAIQVILLLLLALGGMAGAGVSVVALNNWYQRITKDRNIVQSVLNQIGSTYPLGILNLYTLQTAEALLTTTRTDVDQSKLLKALKTVTEGLSQKPETQPKLRQLYVTKGISHPTPTVRAHFINDLYKTAKDGLFEPFMAQLAIETDAAVIEALEVPLVAMANADNLDEFEQLAHNPLPGVRDIAIQVMDKFFNPDKTMGQFFTFLEKEADANNRTLISERVVKRAKENPAAFETLLLEKIKAPEDAVKRTALAAIDAIGDRKHFPAVFEQYGQEAEPTFDGDYQKVFTRLATADHLETLYSGLNHTTARVQGKSLDLIEQLKPSQAIPALLGYVAQDASTAKERAIAIAVASSDQSNHDLFVERLSAPQPLVRLAAIKGVAKMAKAGDVRTLFTAVEAETDQQVGPLLYDLILKTVDKSNGKLLTQKLDQARPALVRGLAAKGLCQIAQSKHVPALYEALEVEPDENIQRDLNAAVTASVTLDNLETLKAKLTSPKASIRLLTAQGLEKLGNPSAVPNLFTALEAEDDAEEYIETETALRKALQASIALENEEILLEKLRSSDGGIRLAAAQGLSKLAQAKNLPALFTAFETERERAPQHAIKEAITVSATRLEALPLLENHVLETLHGDSQRLGVGLLERFALPALSALLTGLEQDRLKVNTARYKQAILAVSGADEAIPTLEPKARVKHPEVRQVAGEALGRIISRWGVEESYDNSRILEQVNTYRAHENSTIQQAAEQAKGTLIDKKTQALHGIGHTSTVRADKDYDRSASTLSNTAQEAPDEPIRDAARRNLSTLKERRCSHLKQEATRLGKEADVSTDTAYQSLQTSLTDIREKAPDKNEPVAKAVGTALATVKERRIQFLIEEAECFSKANVSTDDGYTKAAQELSNIPNVTPDKDRRAVNAAQEGLRQLKQQRSQFLIQEAGRLAQGKVGSERDYEAGQQALAQIQGKAPDNNAQVVQTAQKAAATLKERRVQYLVAEAKDMANASVSSDENYSEAKRKLKALTNHPLDSRISAAAQSSLETLAQKRDEYLAGEVARQARSANISSDHYYRSARATIDALGSKAEGSSVRAAISSALSTLERRRREHVEEERRREEAERRAEEERRRRAEEDRRRREEEEEEERRRRSSSSSSWSSGSSSSWSDSSSSSSSGGSGFGGGMSSGGGGEI